MQKIKDYIKLMRVKHYIKNILIFIPLFFAVQVFEAKKLYIGLQGFICFSLVSSFVYILNDILDIEKDKKHPKKKFRPLASGRVSIKEAICLLCVCLGLAIVFSVLIGNLSSLGLLILYLGLNILYSMKLKDYPIVDIIILASGFVIRIFYGGIITDVEISGWLYLVVVSGALYMGLGKRRNELRGNKDTRKVLKYYNDSFLGKNMYVCVALANVFYALWSMEFENPKMIWTVPIFMVILMCYSYDVEGESDGDPIEVILHDKILVGIVIAYAISLFLLVYFRI